LLTPVKRFERETDIGLADNGSKLAVFNEMQHCAFLIFTCEKKSAHKAKGENI